jgi:hypothetical protein
MFPIGGKLLLRAEGAVAQPVADNTASEMDKSDTTVGCNLERPVRYSDAMDDSSGKSELVDGCDDSMITEIPRRT